MMKRADGRALRFNDRLGFRLMFWVVLISVVSAIAATSVRIWMDYQRDLSDLEGEIAFVRDGLLPGIAQAAWNFDRKQLELLLQGLEASPWLSGVLVQYGPSEKERIVFGETVGRAGERLFVLSYEAGPNKIQVGRLWLFPDMGEVAKRTRERVSVVLVTEAIKVFLLSVMLLWLVGRLITRHLTRISQFATHFEPGSPLTLVTLERNRPQRVDELQILVDSLNAAQARLHEMQLREQGRAQQLKTEVAERTQELALARDRLALCLQGGRLATWEWDTGDGTTHFDDAWFGILGYSGDAMPQTYDTFVRLLHPDDRARVEVAAHSHLCGDSDFFEADFRMRASDGGWRWIHTGGKVVGPGHGGRGARLMGIHQDVTAFKLEQHALEHRAHHDPLTDLPNRALLYDRLERATAAAQRRRIGLAVAYIDLDGFKPINDDFGHEVGDALLVEVARRMRESIREGDTLARVGGDEFVALLVDVVSRDDCMPVLERLLTAASAPVNVGGHVLRVSASVGVALCPNDASQAEGLLRLADKAMYAAKVAGRNRCCWHEAGAPDGQNEEGQ